MTGTVSLQPWGDVMNLPCSHLKAISNRLII
uniref:Uncharacterized protein n=1 Tax=Anguilla anguilla TaxID=7936 RepID=A0A0E9RZA8_ANGAN